MSDIKLKCIDQVLHLVETPSIYSGDVNYDTVTFDFDIAWTGYTKTAIFYRSKDNVFYQLLDNDDRCTVPKEVLTSKGVIYVGVFGVKDDTVLTSEVIRYRILEGAITEDLNTPNPTPDIFEQLISNYDEIKKLANQLVQEQEAYQAKWSEKVDQSIQDATNAKNQCYDAIAGLEYDETDMNGGDPWTDESEYEYDVNGGFPFN